jgi:hypothetical protein
LFLSVKMGIVNICNEIQIFATYCCQSNLVWVSETLFWSYHISWALAQDVSETGVMDSRMVSMCATRFCSPVDSAYLI